MLIIVCGLPGSGKSSLSRQLAKLYGAAHLNSDAIRKAMFPKPSYTEDEKRAVYEEMARRAEELLVKGRSVIADATFFREAYRKAMKDAAAGARVFTIKCILRDEEVKKRLDLREKSGKSLSDADYEVYLGMKGSFEPLAEPYLEVDCMKPKKEVLGKVREFISGGGIG